ncbi:MAG: UDP-glucose--hexose-1-phosphate uridylyltransferase [Saprospiraceae bacterium]
MDLDLNNDPHRRLNILTGEWVLVSPHRAKRPWQGQTEEPQKDVLPSYDPDCYLCPGNSRAGGEQNPAYTDTFSFTNDFAAINNSGNTASFQEGLLVAEGEQGTCRVLCYSPDHSKTLAHLSTEEIEKVIQLWQEQYQEWGELDYVNHVQIFENKGAMMGCSNPHPHGQIWSQTTVPDVVDRKSKTQRKFFLDTEGQSLLSAYLEQEIAEESRIVCVNEHFVALVPWWAVWPFEVMVAPRRPMSSIGDLEAEEAAAFAKTISEVTRRYDALFNTSFPYSAGIHQAPTDDQPQDHWHWHMEFKPPLLRSASVKKHMVGYELFGMPQRDLTAEKAAKLLRKAMKK